MGRSTKTSVQTTSKNKKKKRNLKMAQKRKALTLDLNAAASSVGSSGLAGGFSKVQISSLTYSNITRCTKIEVILTRIGRISYKKSNFSHSYTIWRQLYFSKNCYRRTRKLC